MSTTRQRSLLLVDDDPVFCEVLGRTLMRRGFAVHGALDLEQASLLAERHSPRYAVIDLCIGAGSGLVMLERLMVLDRRIRTVVLTGYASIATAVEAIKLGAVHYLTSPQTPTRSPQPCIVPKASRIWPLQDAHCR